MSARIPPFAKIEATIIDHSALGRCVRITGFRLVKLHDGPHLMNDGHEVVTAPLAKHGGDVDAATGAAFDAFVAAFIDGDSSLFPRGAAS